MHRYVRVRKKLKGERVVLYRLIKEDGSFGSYYLRYRENGKRKWESVGPDLGVAEQQLKQRQASLSAAKLVSIISARKTLRTEIQTFLANKPEAWRHILGVFGDFYGWERTRGVFSVRISKHTLLIWRNSVRYTKTV